MPRSRLSLSRDCGGNIAACWVALLCRCDGTAARPFPVIPRARWYRLLTAFMTVAKCFRLLLAAGVVGAAAAGTIDHTLATKWLPDGYGYDWSRAGYAGGKGIPNPQKLFNVKSYGATGNGRSLDDTAVQAALKAVLGSRGGGVLYFPAGTYVLSKPLYVNASNIVVRGAGREATRLLFTRSLSQVYGVQWGVDNCTGDPTGLWTDGGAMVALSGLEVETSAPARFLANVRVPKGTLVAPGSRRLQVDSTSLITAGQWVQLVIDDQSTADDPVAECEYRKEVYGNLSSSGAAVAAESVAGAPVLSIQSMPAHIAADPIVALAAASKAAGEAGQSVSLAEAAASDARQNANAGRVSAAMAKPGTVAAWLFGENLADSGGPGAIDAGSLQFAFQVLSKGAGWIEADRDILYTIKPGWNARLLSYKPGISNSGVEHLTITFNSSGRYEGHFSDRGYNAVQLANSRDCWVASVRIENADNNIFLFNSSFATVSDVITSSKNRTWSDGQNLNGHHGISLTYGQNVLVTRFNIGARLWHDLHVQTSCKLAVLHNGSGTDLNIDNHRSGPHANLFSNLDFGANTRPFKSGGRKDRGAQTARGSVFWNLRAGAAASSAAIKLPKCDYGALLAFVLKQRSGSSCPASQWKVITWTPSKPVDLHSAQVELRRSLGG
ncbi:hypothetical protein ABPG77_000345 [Micractinium sp. CCAP 211/92]